ncbi:MAG: VCBS repeat-containing protein [Planctomycetes bacterium]|jgi:hypothetical protein|nr:VCBS repeat-containing protein [Planctomycetota bacterium]
MNRAETLPSRFRAPSPGRAALGAALAAAALVAASCGPEREEREIESWIPLEVRAASPDRGPRSGGIPVTVWIASSRYGGEPGAQVSFGGTAAPVLSATGPVSNCFWALSVVSPALPRGPHAVRVELPSGEIDELPAGFVSVPEALGFGRQALSTGLDAPGPLAAGRLFPGSPGLACGHAGAGSASFVVLFERYGNSLAVSRTLDAVEAVVRLAAADFDGDGVDDLAAATGAPPDPSRLRLFPAAAGAAPAAQTILAGSGVSELIAWGPGASGRPDLAAACSAGAVVEAYGNDGAGTFAFRQSLALSSAAAGLAAGFFDADGYRDLCATVPGSSALVLLKGSPSGFLTGPLPAGTLASASCIAPADTDGDGDPDLVLGWSSPAGIRFASNDGLGRFTPGLAISTASAPARIAIADLDLDGNPDILAVCGQKLVIYCTDGSGLILAAKQVEVEFTGNLQDLAVVDIDDDAFPDVFVSEPSTDTICYLRNICF